MFEGVSWSSAKSPDPPCCGARELPARDLGHVPDAELAQVLLEHVFACSPGCGHPKGGSDVDMTSPEQGRILANHTEHRLKRPKRPKAVVKKGGKKAAVTQLATAKPVPVKVIIPNATDDRVRSSCYAF